MVQGALGIALILCVLAALCQILNIAALCTCELDTQIGPKVHGERYLHSHFETDNVCKSLCCGCILLARLFSAILYGVRVLCSYIHALLTCRWRKKRRRRTVAPRRLPPAQHWDKRRNASTQVDPRLLFVRHERLPTYREEPKAAALETTRFFASTGGLLGARGVESFWGFSTESSSQTERRLLGKPKMVDASCETARGKASDGGSDPSTIELVDVETQICPMVVDPKLDDNEILPGITAGRGRSVDDKNPMMSADFRSFAYFISYIDYPAVGSVFSGPWLCGATDFYEGSTIQIEFDTSEDAAAKGRSTHWEPLLPGLHQPWHTHLTSRYTIVPLCALWIRIAPDALLINDLANSKQSTDDGGIDPGSLGKPLVRCYIASVMQGGDKMKLTRKYGTAGDGHYGADQWRLVRVEKAPAHDARHPLAPAIFAGKWKCEKDDLFNGDTIVIEEGGDPSSWYVESPFRTRTRFLKEDLIDLIENKTAVDVNSSRPKRYHLDGSRAKQKSAPPATPQQQSSAAADKGPEVMHHIGSLSADKQTMVLSLEYGDAEANPAATRQLSADDSDAASVAAEKANRRIGFSEGWACGHYGRSWTLTRVSHVGKDFVKHDDPRPHRWFKHRQLEHHQQKTKKQQAESAAQAMGGLPIAPGTLLSQPEIDKRTGEVVSIHYAPPSPPPSATASQNWRASTCAATTLTEISEQEMERRRQQRGLLPPLPGRPIDAKSRAFASVYRSKSVEMRTVGV